MKSWGKFCKERNKKPRRFSKDVPTCWNSTYDLGNHLNIEIYYAHFFFKY